MTDEVWREFEMTLYDVVVARIPSKRKKITFFFLHNSLYRYLLAYFCRCDGYFTQCFVRLSN